jgi:hypothetical protein
MQRPMKCSDSHAGHNHESPNNVLEIQVASIQAEKSAIASVRFHFFR